MNKLIYLDYAATTPVDPRVAEKMMQFLTMDGIFGNPASRSHRYGWQAEEAVDEARAQVAELLNADPREIVFTSGATESDNLALKGVAEFYQEQGKHIITVQTEHKAVLDSCADLERRGFAVTYLSVDEEGLLSLQELRDAIRPDTILVSVMHVNNETGVIQDIPAISNLCREKNVLLHVDAAQSVAKIDVDVEQLGVDLLSLSGHKIYGPKGVGALYVRRKPRVRLHAQMHGGGHERGMRSGTMATHQIAGLGEAARIAHAELKQESKILLQLRESLWQGLSGIEGVFVNGSEQQRAPGILNVGFKEVDGESLLLALNNLAVSTGSACNSASMEPSYVLRAMGLSDQQAHASVRFSLGRFTTEEDVKAAIEHVRNAIGPLRAMSKALPG
ncbi:IscS subfamily cysteine desulfurase [Aliidiomarina minuta]|uniref:Cysteine desulfurase IscS n=1 Tax=Aliidiomarina minuta TaxID=880057 RepID=A0A432W8Q4_9GAMM|nr:IscS subfamily cysteine desulfurase [Aliidiomarina minuta]RUO26449.1 IscS subfamily cysteine desulfurase [Aliidiomarina minuta]